MESTTLSSKKGTTMSRNVRNRRPALESMEGRLAPSSIAPGMSPAQEVRHDRNDNDRNDNHRNDNHRNDNHRNDNHRNDNHRNDNDRNDNHRGDNDRGDGKR
jgi:hypothetical protein